MIETKKVKYGYLCKRCFHSVDNHQYMRGDDTPPSGGTGNCRHVVERSYPGGGLSFLAGDDESKRVYCGCDYFDPIRVKLEEQRVRE